MLVTSHVLVGAALGAVIERPGWALLAGAASHLPMDATPHWGVPRGDQFLAVARRDGLTGLAVMGLCVAAAPGARRWPVLAGMVGGALPDLDKPAEHFLGIDPFPGWFARLHARVQREAGHRLPHEVRTAAVLGAVTLLLLRRRTA